MCSVSVVFVVVWCFQLMVLLGLLGAFHIYMRHTSGERQLSSLLFRFSFTLFVPIGIGKSRGGGPPYLRVVPPKNIITSDSVY